MNHDQFVYGLSFGLGFMCASMACAAGVLLCGWVITVFDGFIQDLE